MKTDNCTLLWVQLFFVLHYSIYVKYQIMAKKDTKQLLFENMEKLNPGFNIQEVDPNTPQPTSGAQQYSDKTYQMIASQLKLVNTPEKFAPAFRSWFQYLGYTPQAGNMTVQRARMDVEAIMKELGYH
jgi:hypothetical protein